MTLDDQEITRLRQNGAKVFQNGRDFAPRAKPANSPDATLVEIAATLKAILARPQPEPEPAAAPQVTVEPQIIVQPAPVTVQQATPKERPRKWKFELDRGINGQLTQIIATAMD